MYPKECPIGLILAALPIYIQLNNKECFIAGGFVRRWWNNIKQDSDIDLFFKDAATYDKITAVLEKISIIPVVKSEFNQMYEIKVNDTWTIKVQAIKHKFYSSMDDLLDSFDFTICQFGFDGQNILMTNEALIDSQRKRLVPHKIQFGVSSLRRIIKYTSQGYYMCAGAATAFLQQVVSKPETLDTKVISMD